MSLQQVTTPYSNRGKVASEEQKPETRDHNGWEGITLSAVVCGALDDFSGGPEQGAIKRSTL